MTIRRLTCVVSLVVLLAILALPGTTVAQASSPASAAESIRSALLQAQFDLGADGEQARVNVDTALATYQSALAPALREQAPQAATQAETGFEHARQATTTANVVQLAAARSEIWTALLAGSYTIVERRVTAGDVAGARDWLLVREFRHATRFTRPNADATLALATLAQGTTTPEAAWSAVQADLLDTYQARLGAALADLAHADSQNFATRRAETAALASGYFAILAPSYAEQRGAEALAHTQADFAALGQAALASTSIAQATDAIEADLAGFRAAPLSPEDQARRAGQLLRFLALVPVEYGRGIRGGQVAVDLEIREAITFADGAAAAFADLRPILEAQDAEATTAIAEQLNSVRAPLAAAAAHSSVAEPSAISADVEALVTALKDSMPAEWQTQDAAADFDVINTALDQMEAAVGEDRYDLAESARLEAYAILESGPEARLTAFAPQYVSKIEDLFWYGQGEAPGLAYLIDQHAPASAINASRKVLTVALSEAQGMLVGKSAPASVASNAGLIVFREGMEAVLILASLLGSLKVGTARRLRAPIWWGAVVAIGASILTWLLFRSALQALAAYGERLEAVVSLVAVGVLLLIMNWFFHDVYWKGWMANFHHTKKQIISGNAGQWLGLAVLGFTSIYREGFETALFLQALVLSSDTLTVLLGVAAGAAGTLLLGLAVFGLQAKLPHKKMLIVTGVLIGAVLLQMVGGTVHSFQVVGWLPTHPIRGVEFPYWFGMWFGVYATWEGLALQLAAGVFTIGSYFLAEHLNRRELRAAMARHQASPAS